MRRSLPRSACRVRSSTFTSSRTRCETTVSCCASRTCLTSGPQPELGNVEADAFLLPGAERQQVFDEPVQLDAVVAQDGHHFALGVVQGSDRPVHEQFRALADVGQRRLELVRHVAQKPVSFLRQVEQAQPQPFELRAEPLEVARTGHFDRARKRAAAELADGAVDGAQRPADGQGQRQDGDQGQRHQQRGLPEQPLLRAGGLPLQLRQPHVDLLVAAVDDVVGEIAEPLEARRGWRRRPGLFGGVELTALAISLCMAAKSSRLRRVVSASSSAGQLRARARQAAGRCWR